MAVAPHAGHPLELNDEDGMTLPELLVVLVVLGIVLAGLSQLFISALHSETDQTNRVGAQTDARLALDKLRREIHCASVVSSVASSSLTVSLPSYCSNVPSSTLSSAVTLPNNTISVASTAKFNTGANTISIGSSGNVSCSGKTSTTFTGCSGGVAGTYASGSAVSSSVTWCTSGASAPFTLKRFVGTVCSGSTGISWVNSLASNAIFTYNRTSLVLAPSLAVAAAGGTLRTGTYAYDISAVLSNGTEISGAINRATVATGAASQITVTWTAYAPTAPLTVTSYRVYGRDDGTSTSAGLRLLRTVTPPTTTYVDTGDTKLTAPGVTIPAGGLLGVTINVADTSSFNIGGSNTISFGNSGSVTCTGTTGTSFTTCSGGTAGTYAIGTVVTNASTTGPPLASIGVSLQTDKSPSDTVGRFSFSDDIVLRNSGRF